MLDNDKKAVVMITGATGFVGFHLVKRLVSGGWMVHTLSRKGSSFTENKEFGQVVNHVYDGTTESVLVSFEAAKPDIVFHLASLFLAQHSNEDVEPLIRTNVLLGTQLLEAMTVNKVKYFVNTGTAWQHYNNDDYNPVCLYAATKQAFEAVLEYFVNACAVKAITLKLFDTYGPGDHRPKLFNMLKKASISGEVLNMSPGDQMIDMVHINDVIDAFLIAARRLLMVKAVVGHEVYAVSSGAPISLKELVCLYTSIRGEKIEVNWGGRPYRSREVMKTWNRGAAIAQWSPKINLEDGIRRLGEC